MKKETIIAKIETYINTLPESERKYYNGAFDISEKDGQPIKECFKNYREPVIELAEIVQELQKELKEQAQKETKGGSYVKRSKLITRLLAKSNNKNFAKGFFEEINGEKMQCIIIDGFYAFAFRNTVDVPMFNEKQPFTVQRVIPAYKDFKTCAYDMAEIKTALKMHKAKKDKTRHSIVLNDKRYDTEFFINVVEGLGGDITFYQNSAPIGPDVFESENGLAVLMPMRKER